MMLVLVLLHPPLLTTLLQPVSITQYVCMTSLTIPPYHLHSLSVRENFVLVLLLLPSNLLTSLSYLLLLISFVYPYTIIFPSCPAQIH